MRTINEIRHLQNVVKKYEDDLHHIARVERLLEEYGYAIPKDLSDLDEQMTDRCFDANANLTRDIDERLAYIDGVMDALSASDSWSDAQKEMYDKYEDELVTLKEIHSDMYGF